MDNAGTFTGLTAMFIDRTGVFMDDLSGGIGDAVTSTDDSGTRTHHAVVFTGSPRLCWTGTHFPMNGAADVPRCRGRSMTPDLRHTAKLF